MRALGLDPVRLEQANAPLFRNLQRKCVSCDSHERCDAELQQGTYEADFQDYCPNADVLVSLRIGGGPIKRHAARSRVAVQSWGADSYEHAVTA
jgi:hypothetical protein